MKNLYVLTENNRELAGLVCDGSILVLLQDAVYLLTETPAILEQRGIDTYVFEADARERGMEEALPPSAQRVDYPELVQLLMDRDHRVINL